MLKTRSGCQLDLGPSLLSRIASAFASYATLSAFHAGFWVVKVGVYLSYKPIMRALTILGTFYSEPPKAPHFTWAKDGEVIIQVTGVGPMGKTFIPQPK